MRYEASRALRKRHEALRCVTDRHDNKRHERHEGGIHDLAALAGAVYPLLSVKCYTIVILRVELGCSTTFIYTCDVGISSRLHV